MDAGQTVSLAAWLLCDWVFIIPWNTSVAAGATLLTLSSAWAPRVAMKGHRPRRTQGEACGGDFIFSEVPPRGKCVWSGRFHYTSLVWVVKRLHVVWRVLNLEAVMVPPWRPGNQSARKTPHSSGHSLGSCCSCGGGSKCHSWLWSRWKFYSRQSRF